MASPAPNWPDIQVMLQSLQTSGVLTQTEPAGPIQPLPRGPEPEKRTLHLQNLVTVTEVATPTAKVQVGIMERKWIHWLTKFVGLALSFQSMYSMYLSFHFLFVEYALLEQKLMAGHVEPVEVNHLAGEAIIELISAIISMFFALRLTVLQSRTAHDLHVFFGVIFFGLNLLVMLGYLDFFDFAGPITRAVLSLIDLVRQPSYNW